MSKKLISDLMKISKNVEATKKFDNGVKWKVEVEGEYKDMSNKNMTINDLAKIVEAGFKELKTDVRDIKVRLDNLETDVKQLKTDVKQLKTDVNQLKTDVNQLKTDVNQLKTDVKEIKSLPTIQNELKK